MNTALQTAIAAVLTLCVTCAVANEEVVGSVKRAQGTVTIERDGAKLPAPPGAVLHKGDRINTEADAYAELRLHGAAPLRIGPNARVAVDRFAATDNTPTGKSVPRFFQGLASLLAGASRY